MPFFALLNYSELCSQVIMLLDESCFNLGNRIQCIKLNACASVIRVVNLKYLLPELSNIFFCVLKVTSESVDDLVVVLYTGLDLENVRLRTENCKNLAHNSVNISNIFAIED